MPAKQLRIPPVFGILLRGYAVVGATFILFEVGFLPNRGLAIFLISMTSIAMLFGIGHLFVAGRRPIKKASMDVPSMLMLYVGGTFVMYFITLLTDQGILNGQAAFVLLAACSLGLVFAAVGSFLVEIASNLKCTIEPLPKSR